MKEALILVDIQNDFIPGGALAVPQGDEIVPVANRVQAEFDLIVATQDWHPRDHQSFASHHPGRNPGDRIDLHGVDQVLWPDHCVQNTPGAAFHPHFDFSRVDHVVRKGTDPAIDSYSAFFDNEHRKATGLHDYLQQKQVTDIYIMGLATDYCVLYSVRDARKLGYRTFVIQDGCRGIDLQPGDVDRAIEEMEKIGATVVQSDQIHAARSVTAG